LAIAAICTRLAIVVCPSLARRASINNLDMPAGASLAIYPRPHTHQLSIDQELSSRMEKTAREVPRPLRAAGVLGAVDCIISSARLLRAHANGVVRPRELFHENFLILVLFSCFRNLPRRRILPSPSGSAGFEPRQNPISCKGPGSASDSANARATIRAVVRTAGGNRHRGPG
jgi:hypothetical protein